MNRIVVFVACVCVSASPALAQNQFPSPCDLTLSPETTEQMGEVVTAANGEGGCGRWSLVVDGSHVSISWEADGANVSVQLVPEECGSEDAVRAGQFDIEGLAGLTTACGPIAERLRQGLADASFGPVTAPPRAPTESESDEGDGSGGVNVRLLLAIALVVGAAGVLLLRDKEEEGPIAEDSAGDDPASDDATASSGDASAEGETNDAPAPDEPGADEAVSDSSAEADDEERPA